jgi:hypothetical protein
MTTASTPSPIPSSTSTPVESMIIGLDSISYEHDGRVDVIALDDGASVLAIFESINGFLPTGNEIESAPGYPTGLIAFRWSEVIVTVSDQGPANFVILSPTINGVSIQTTEGIAVGSSRSEVMAAGVRDYVDEDKDGTADHLALGSREVPGTRSLDRDGFVGAEFLLLVMYGDTVERILVPANDFSDL